MPWVDRVSTIRGILWAHDTACATVRAIIALAPTATPHILAPWSINFAEDHERGLEEKLRTSGLQ